jgi:hypothetical protein
MGITVLTLTDQLRRELEARGGFSQVAHGVLVWQVDKLIVFFAS